MGSTLDLAPRTNTARGVGSNAEPAILPPAYSAVGQALRRAGRDDYHAWLDHVRPAAGCTRPIRLVGTLDTVNPATGQHLHRRHTDELPDAAIYKACGNRRSAVCPSCAQTYQRDAYQLLRAGLVGGKGVPGTVAQHPAVFPTFTAPSFGIVHSRRVSRHTCTNRKRCDCRPDPCHARRADDPTAGLCPHARPAVCWTRHEPDDPILGQPLCLDCYDHNHQVVWNLFTGKLWHRTKQAIERHLAKLARQRGIPDVEIVTASGMLRSAPPVRVSHGKAAEFQARGAIHFHALLRLDGVDPDDPDAVVPPPAGFTVADLDAAVRHVATHVALTTPPHPDRPDGWPIVWGDQVDVQPLMLAGDGSVTDEMVADHLAAQKAGYLAKYATKSTEVTGHISTRLDNDTIDVYANPDGDHTARLIAACWHLGRPTDTPVPLSRRPARRRPAHHLDPRRICPGCGTATRLVVCSTCSPTVPADTYVSISAGDNPYPGLRRWAHMLGFGGHFLTKARRYSVTFKILRTTRITFRRAEDQDQADGVIRTADHTDEETTLIVGTLTFAGVGWHTTGDALLANTAAAQARERQRIGREELAHELGSTIAAGTMPTAA